MIAQHIRMGGFGPLGYELAFGEEDGLPPIVLDLSSGERVSLTGRIDRGGRSSGGGRHLYKGY